MGTVPKTVHLESCQGLRSGTLVLAIVFMGWKIWLQANHGYLHVDRVNTGQCGTGGLFSVSGNRENLTLPVALIGSEFAAALGCVLRRLGAVASGGTWLYSPRVVGHRLHPA